MRYLYSAIALSLLAGTAARADVRVFDNEADFLATPKPYESGGPFIRYARRYCGWSLADLAGWVGISPSTLGRIERMEVRAPEYLLTAIARTIRRARRLDAGSLRPGPLVRVGEAVPRAVLGRPVGGVARASMRVAPAARGWARFSLVQPQGSIAQTSATGVCWVSASRRLVPTRIP